MGTSHEGLRRGGTFIPHQTVKTYARTNDHPHVIEGTTYNITKCIVLHEQLKAAQLKEMKKLVDDGTFKKIRSKTKVRSIE